MLNDQNAIVDYLYFIDDTRPANLPKQKISQMVNFGNKRICNAKESMMREEPTMYFKFKTHNKQRFHIYK